MIKDIEEAKKRGESYRKKRQPTPKKPKKIEFCKKFKNNPYKFFSHHPAEIELKRLNSSGMKLNRCDTDRSMRVGHFHYLDTDPLEEDDRICKTETNSPNKSKRGNTINSIIRKINIEDNIDSIEMQASQMLEDDTKPNLLSPTTSPAKNKGENTYSRRKSL